jgi:chromosome segregation ATPase
MAANLVEVITPMPDDSAKSRAAAALERVNAIVIRTNEDYVTAAGQLAEIKGQFKAVDKQREELKAPSLEACRRVDAFFKPPLTFLAQAETILKGKLTDYDKEQERLRRAEQARLDEIARKERERKEAEAREIERKAREKAEGERRAAEAQRQAEARARQEAAEAKARGDREAAFKAEREAREAAAAAQKAEAKADRVESAAAERSESLQAEAAQVVAPVVQRAPPKVSGLSFTEVAKFEVVDKAKLPLEYLVPDEVRIGKVVRALKTDANIPGVRVWMEKQPASKASA